MATSTATTQISEKRTHGPSDFSFLLQVSRPGLWTTTAMFYLMPLGHVDLFHPSRLWLGLFYVLFPLGLLLYGVNDLVDAKEDLLNPRKGTFLFGSRGSAEQLKLLRWLIGVAQIPFLVVLYFLIGPRILLWFAVMLMAVAIYNVPRIGWKSHPPFDVLIQASYLLIFVLSSWLNHANQLPWQTFVFGALFAMHSHIFGEVMDLEPDRLSGRRTTAARIGRVASKFFIAGLLCAETAMVSIWFRDWVIAGFLAIGALWFVVDATLAWKDRAYSPTEMRCFMWGWNLVAVLGVVWNWRHATLTQPVTRILF